MDTIPDVELIEIFDRFTRWVSMRGANSPRKLNKRINRVMKLMRLAMMNAKRSRTVTLYRNRYNNMRKLKRHGIVDRIMNEAARDENSIYALSMKYGYARARKFKLEQEKRRIRRGRRR